MKRVTSKVNLMLESITSSVKEKSIDYKEKLTYLDSAKAESPR